MKQLQERIQQDLANTPYGTEPEKRVLLKTLLAEIKLKKGNNPSDEDVLAIVRKFKENAYECNNLYEILILDAYLPQMMSEDEMKIIVHDIVTLNNLAQPSDLGQVMKMVGMYGPTIDKKFCSSLAKELLAQ